MEAFEAEEPPVSFLRFLFMALGIRYTLLLPLAGFVCFLLAVVIVLRGKGPMAVAALLLVVHVPFLIGVYGAIDGMLASYMIIARSSVSPKPSVIAEGGSMSLVAPLVGMVLMIPGYVCAAFGACVRALLMPEEGRPKA